MKTTRLVNDAMRAPVHTIHCQKTVAAAEDFLVQMGITGAPMVATDGQIMGVVSKTDIARFHHDERRRDAGVEMIYEVGSPVPITVEQSETTQAAAALMVEHRIHRLIVVNGGVPVGILTTFDIARLYAET